MTMIVNEKQELTPYLKTTPTYKVAKDAFYAARELRNLGEIAERELEAKFLTFRSQAFQAMSAGLISIQEYLEIMLLYPDYTYRHGIKKPQKQN